MSHIHFVANKKYKNRIIQLGENSKNIHVVGGLGADSLSKIKYHSKKYLEKKFKVKFYNNGESIFDFILDEQKENISIINITD